MKNHMRHAIAICAAIMLGGSATAQPAGPKTLTGTGGGAGYWQGYNTASQVPGQRIPTAFVLNQSGSQVTGGYVTATGVYGTAQGSFSGNTGTLTWTNTTPQCPGNYTNNYTLSGDIIYWTYTGKDCLGNESGSGWAQRVPISIAVAPAQ